MHVIDKKVILYIYRIALSERNTCALIHHNNRKFSKCHIVMRYSENKMIRADIS